MWHFHEMRLFVFARRHIKIFCNSWLSELETAVFDEMFATIYFLNLFFISFYFAWYQSWYQVKKVRIILGGIIWFSFLSPKLRQANKLYPNIIETRFLGKLLISEYSTLFWENSKIICYIIAMGNSYPSVTIQLQYFKKFIRWLNGPY